MVASLLGRLKRPLSAVATGFRRRPFAVGAALLTALLAGGGAAWLLIPPSETATDKPTIEDALKALDAGDRRRAVTLATELRVSEETSYAESGGPLFVLGAATALEAEERTVQQPSCSHRKIGR